MRLNHYALALVCFSAMSSVSWAQGLGSGNRNVPDQIMAPNVNGIFVSPVQNAPFSGVVEVVSKQSFGDGSTNTLRMINYTGRDSKGRTYTERRRFVAEGYQGEPPLQVFLIFDTEAGVDYRLDPYLLVAWKTVTEMPPTPNPETVPITDPKGSPGVNIEDLGTQIFDGMTIHGTRQTKPDGTVDEYWYSPDLSMCTMRKHKDARWEQTFTLTKLDRHEPDASKFAVPANYKIVAQGPRQLAGEPGVYTVGGGVTPPVVIHSVNPSYSQQARAAKVKGICVVSLIVDVDGVPQHVRIVRGLGNGLDENAVAAVQQYRFKPAQWEGTPVPVQVNIEVKFDIY